MTWWEALVLGIIQGLTEFIPVSSSGHLVYGQYWLGLDMEGDLTFEVFVHFGTILSILTVYWQRVNTIVADSWSAVRKPAQLKHSFEENVGFRTAMLILLTMVPTGLAYVLLRDRIGDAFADPVFVSYMLLITGTILVFTLLRPHPTRDVTVTKALLLGVAQSFALFPGISRSGATICTAIYLNIDREKAANFSFLMLLPVVLGATALEAVNLFSTWGEGTVGFIPLFVGTLAAYICGIWAIKLVIVFTKRNRLPYFAAYCFAIATLNLIVL